MIYFALKTDYVDPITSSSLPFEVPLREVWENSFVEGLTLPESWKSAKTQFQNGFWHFYENFTFTGRIFEI